MITGIHGMYYSDRADETRAFLRDKLGLPARDVGGGWLIFDFPQADMGVHPASGADTPAAPDSPSAVGADGEPDGQPTGTHYVSFTCQDIHATVAELRERGVEFDDDVTDQGYGLAIHFTMPGHIAVELYEPR